MPALRIELGYTRGTPSKYSWLTAALPNVLRQLGLDTVVVIAPAPIMPAVDPPFFDLDLYELTKKVIERSPVRRSAEASGAWYVHLVVTSFHQNRFLGVMYDFAFDSRQRQGCAIFENEILDVAEGSIEDARHVILRTALHEIGHCLNLIHRNDRTIMAQTGSIMDRADWIRRMRFEYSPSDAQFVIQRPTESRPGGTSSLVGRAEDEALPVSTDKFAITFADFNQPGNFSFRCGSPVSLIVKLRNKTSQDLALPLPLHSNSENMRVWVRYPGGKDIRIRKSIKGCGSLKKKLVIRAGDYRLLPVNLYSDNAGYIFDTPGKYGIKLAVKDSAGNWLTSRFQSIRITGGQRKKGRLTHQTAGITKFIELGGSSSSTVRASSLALAHEDRTGLGRSVYWNLSYKMKSQVFDTEIGSSIQRMKAEQLLRIYQSLLRVEKSPVRRGKVVLNCNKLSYILRKRPLKLSKNQLKDINAYQSFTQKLINV